MRGSAPPYPLGHPGQFVFYYASGLEIFFLKNLFAMVQDLDSFLHTFIRYGSGLTLFSAKNSSLWFRTWNFFQFFFSLWLRSSFFFFNFSSMAQDLRFFFHKKFIRYASGLKFFFPQKFLQYGSGLRFFSAKIYSLWLRT